LTSQRNENEVVNTTNNYHVAYLNYVDIGLLKPIFYQIRTNYKVVEGCHTDQEDNTE